MATHASELEGFARSGEVEPRTPAAVITIDLNGRILDLTAGAEKLFGFSRVEAVGALMSELIIPARLRPAHEAGLTRYRDTGTSGVLDTRLRMPAVRRDGREIEVELVITRVRFHGGEAFAGFLRETWEPAPIPGELQLQADFYRTLVEQSPIMVAVFDGEGREAWSSEASRSLIGPTSGLTIDQLINDMVFPADRELARSAFEQAGEGGVSDPIDLRIRASDGSWRAVSLVARNLSAHPAVHGMAVYSTDVTRARAAELRERLETTRLMTLIESLNVGVLLQDERRRVVLTNAAFVELFELGLPPESLCGSSRLNHADFSHRFADPKAVYDRADEIVRRGRPAFGDELSLADGRVVERDYVPIVLDGSTLGHLWVFRDVTSQAELRRSLQERNRILTELSALKTEFVAVVSHELRTPLTSIATFASMLDDDDALDTENRGAAVAAIRRNADRLLSLVADLILLARLESGEMSLAAGDVDLAAVLRASCAALDGDCTQIDIAGGPIVLGDESLLRQLFDTVLGVVAGAGGYPSLSAVPGEAAWTVRVSAVAGEPATPERLLSTRLPHPDVEGERRTGALALMLARAIATRHGGALSTTMGHTNVTMTVTLPYRGNRPANFSQR
jgi:PAS domain S-box-containing protein